MTETKKILIALSIVVVGVTIMVTMIMPLHPLFRSPKRVLNDTLKLTPMGTHIDDVAALVESKTIIKNVTEWREPTIRYDSGYVNPNGEVPGWSTTVSPGNRSIVGHKSIEVSYKAHYNTYISIYWGFDEDGKLVDVFVDKNFDMIDGGGARRTAE